MGLTSKRAIEDEQNILKAIGFVPSDQVSSLYRMYLKPIAKNKKVMCFIVPDKKYLEFGFTRWVEYYKWYKLKSRDNGELFDLDDFLIMHYSLTGRMYIHTYYGQYLQPTITHLMFKNHYDELNTHELSLAYELIQHDMLVVKKHGELTYSPRSAGVIIINSSWITERGFKLSTIIHHEISHVVFQYNQTYRVAVEQAFLKITPEYRKHVITYLTSMGYMYDHMNEWGAQVIECSADNHQIMKHTKKSDIAIINNLRKVFYSETA